MFFSSRLIPNDCTVLNTMFFQLATQLASLTADIFASFGVLHLRAYTLQDATFYACSCLYNSNFTISTLNSRHSHCFNCLKLFYEDRPLILAFLRKANYILLRDLKLAKTRFQFANVFFKHVKHS